MLRSSVIGIGLAVTALLAFQVGGCSSGGGGTGGSSGTGTAGTTGKGGNSSPGTGGNSTGGTTGTGGTTTGTGGTATGTGGTATGTGGTSTGTGGTSAGTAGSGAGGSGGSGTGGSGGSGTGGSGGSGTGGSGGSGTGGSGGSGTGGTPGFGQPTCAGTVTKGGTCAATDQQLCYKTCGPGNLGRKSETCTAGADGGMTYMEMTGCSYDPTGDYACYKVPTTANAACPSGAPMGSASCTVADPCTVCNDTGGLAGGMYMDSSGMKQGFCVCVNSKWTCASNTAWPCGGTPVANNPGCQ
jgi:hypothetical protein